MKCPIDDIELKMADRNGIEIDYCPKCRGVWLDRGELDKIIERAAGQMDAPPPRPRADEQEGGSYRHGRDFRRDGDRPRERRSMLDDLFDF